MSADSLIGGGVNIAGEQHRWRRGVVSNRRERGAAARRRWRPSDSAALRCGCGPQPPRCPRRSPLRGPLLLPPLYYGLLLLLAPADAMNPFSLSTSRAQLLMSLNRSGPAGAGGRERKGGGASWRWIRRKQNARPHTLRELPVHDDGGTQPDMCAGASPSSVPPNHRLTTTQTFRAPVTWSRRSSRPPAAAGRGNGWQRGGAGIRYIYEGEGKEGTAATYKECEAG